MNLPRGVWAITPGSGNDAASEVAESASACSCPLAWREPGLSPADSLKGLRAVRGQLPFLSVHGPLAAALLARADAIVAGVRTLPLDDLGPLRSPLLLGASVHGVEEADQAARAGADFLIFGPIWETPAKRGILSPREPELLAELVERVGLPLLAVGGIERPERVEAVCQAGAHGLLCLRAAQDPKLLRELIAAWKEPSQDG